MRPRTKRRITMALCAGAIAVGAGIYYARTHPLVFNESAWEHAHCIKMAGLDLAGCAPGHGRRFHSHSSGCGNALLMLTRVWLPSLAVPGDGAAVCERPLRTGQSLPEAECGRV